MGEFVSGIWTEGRVVNLSPLTCKTWPWFQEDSVGIELLDTQLVSEN